MCVSDHVHIQSKLDKNSESEFMVDYGNVINAILIYSNIIAYISENVNIRCNITCLNNILAHGTAYQNEIMPIQY